MAFAKRPVRRAQLITTFGVGAIVDFRGPESMMTAGLEVWPCAGLSKDHVPEIVVREPRLEARLAVDHFRLPPSFESDESIPEYIPFVRFPLWHYCPDCEVMKKLHYFEHRVNCEKAECEKRGKWLLPVRVIAVCPEGHAEDFPFIEWVHSGAPRDAKHTLYWRARGESASLSGIKLECSCGQNRTLAGAFNYDERTGSALTELGIRCNGKRPWLADNGENNTCREHLRIVQRGATNTYFASIRSSIFLPMSSKPEDSLMSREARKIVEKFKDADQGELKSVIKTVATMQDLDEKVLAELVREKCNECKRMKDIRDQTEEQFRADEYSVLTGDNLRPGEELQMNELPVAEYGDLSQFLKRVRRINKLRETRVLKGFTRLQPPDEENQRREQVLSRKKASWLPAIVVNGEGIFLELDNNAIDNWHSAQIQGRVKRMQEEYSSRIPQSDSKVKKFIPKFVLLHTLAHLLIRELSFECGYGTAALRERIYCNVEEGTLMSGILIYTASGDSEGTMGGLVRQGKPDRLVRTVRSALLKARWCTADPVCIESTGQGINNSNLAACHGCVLLPETSCEEGNRILDRALLTGTIKRPELAFFDSLLRKKAALSRR